MFAKRHYEFLAQSLAASMRNQNQLGHYAQETGIASAVVDLADRLEQNNPRFDRDKFLKACGFRR